MTAYHPKEIAAQISECVHVLKHLLGQDLLAIYLYGSAIVGGLQKFSDLDLLVVVGRETTVAERTQLISHLLSISGLYAKSTKPPIEMTIVVQSAVNPWRYPPQFDFQYGEWLRDQFESAHMTPWSSKVMPDLALLITQVLLANRTLLGPSPDKLLCKVPYEDFLAATKSALAGLPAELHSDTRNVLLTTARIWRTVATDTICTKPDAAAWAFSRLPDIYQPVMKRAYAICIGEEIEHWDDMSELLQPTTNYMIQQITPLIASIEASDHSNKSIRLAE